MSYVKVKNWDKFQSIQSSRAVDWIKLHVQVLDDYEFERLPDETKAHLILIWVMAARCGNRMPYDREWFQRKIPVNSFIDLELLIERGWLQIEEGAWPRLPLFAAGYTDKQEDVTVAGARSGEESRGEERRATPATPADARAREATAEPSPHDPVLLTFPVKGGKVKGRPCVWEFRQSQLDKLQATEPFTQLNVLVCIQEAHAWIGANRERVKTWDGMPRFIVRWLIREGRLRGNTAAPEKTAYDVLMERRQLRRLGREV